MPKRHVSFVSRKTCRTVNQNKSTQDLTWIFTFYNLQEMDGGFLESKGLLNFKKMDLLLFTAKHHHTLISKLCSHFELCHLFFLTKISDVF